MHNLKNKKKKNRVALFFPQKLQEEIVCVYRGFVARDKIFKYEIKIPF